MDLISVIIPVYKVEPYIHQCIDSVLNQTYTNLEIILVDDGSPDNCGAICDEYARKDSRVTVIHKENGGVSSARNAGIDMSSGEWIAFVDADDYIDYDMYEKLLSVAKHENADVVECNYRRGDILERGDGSLHIHTGMEAIRIMFTEDAYPIGFAVSPCNKLLRKNILSDIRFLNGCSFAEDMLFTVEVFYKTRTIVKYNMRLYTYRLTENSATSTTYNVKKADEVDAAQKAMLILEDSGDVDLLNITSSRYVNLMLNHWCLCRKQKNQNSYYEKTLYLRKMFQQQFPKIVKRLNFLMKLKGYLFYFMPDLYYHIYCLRGV